MAESASGAARGLVPWTSVDGAPAVADDNLTRLLIFEEGLRLKPYEDNLGVLTIGVGRNLRDRGISAPEAMILLAFDRADAEATVARLCPWATRLDPVRYAALVSLAFQLGPTKLAKFQMTLRLLEAGRWDAAALNLGHTRLARQTPHRVHRLQAMIRTGEWPEEVGRDTWR